MAIYLGDKKICGKENPQVTEWTSVANVPASNNLAVCTVNDGGEFSLAEVPQKGNWVMVVFKNTSEEDITISIPTSGNYASLDSVKSITVPANGYAGIRTISDGKVIYIDSISVNSVKIGEIGSSDYWDNGDAMAELKSKDEESFNVLDELYNICEASEKAGVVRIVMKDECTDSDLENYGKVTVDGNAYQLARGVNTIECDEFSYLYNGTTNSNYVECNMSEVDIVGKVVVRSQLKNDSRSYAQFNLIYRALHPKDWAYDATSKLMSYDFTTLVHIGGKPTYIDYFFSGGRGTSPSLFGNQYFDLKGAFIKNFDLSECQTTDMSCFFDSCTSLSDLSPISDWQFPNVTNMSFFFDSCTSLSDLSPISDWQFPNVTDMRYFFYGCSSLSDLSPISDWQFPNVTNMRGFFYDCSSLSDLSPISDWQFPNVTDMRYFFYCCSSLSDLSPIDGWETPKITSKISNFAYNCPLTDESKTICDNHNWGY